MSASPIDPRSPHGKIVEQIKKYTAKAMSESFIPLDEEGEVFLREDAPIVKIDNYGDVQDPRFEGRLVQLVDVCSRFIKVEPIDEPFADFADNFLLCRPDELIPLNDYAREVLSIMKEISVKGFW